jgi:protoheme IX farnesyltransferase
MSPPVLAPLHEKEAAAPAGPAPLLSEPAPAGSWATLAVWARDYHLLFKSRIAAFVALATAAGFYLGAAGPVDGRLLFHTLFGTALLSAAASTLNQLIERRLDARMVRTRDRPLPAGRISPAEALCLGSSLAVIGLADLALAVHPLPALLGGFTLLSYVFAYTPLKPRTHLSTLVGGVPGALPPVIGWAAVRGEVGPEALSLFAILFLWQLPHFLAIARIYREDYARAGFPVLTVADPDGRATGRAIVVNCLALLLAGLLPAFLRLTGVASFFGALALGLVLLGFGVDAAFRHGPEPARRLLWASLAYLPSLLIIFMLDKA